MTRPPDSQGRSKEAARRRIPLNSGGKGMPRIMWLAIVVVAVGAFFLFRQGGDDVPTGIGEQRTVVTSEAAYEALDADTPRSGDVDIAQQENTLVPEKPEDAATAPAEQQPVQKPAAQATTQAPTPKPALPKPEPKPEPTIPQDNGPYMVQLGSYGSADNANKEAARVEKPGWNPVVKVGNTSDGQIIYRVRIGYFPSRSEAEKFIRENRKILGGAIAVHR